MQTDCDIAGKKQSGRDVRGNPELRFVRYEKQRRNILCVFFLFWRRISAAYFFLKVE